MSEYLFIDVLETPVDEMIAAYLDERGDVAYPVVLPDKGARRVVRDNGELAAMIEPSVSMRAMDESEQEEGAPVDLARIIADAVDTRLEEAFVIEDADIPGELWEEEATAAYVDNFNGKFPQALIDEFGCLWQISSSMSLLDMFACYASDTWGRKKNLDECWEVFAESCELSDAAVLVGKHLESDILPNLDNAGRLHNPSGVYLDYDAGMLVRSGGADTMISDLDDLTEHIVASASASSDLVPIFDYCLTWEVFMRPGASDLARALDACPAYVEGGWADYPYTCEKKDDASVQMRVGNAWDLLYLTCDCDVEDWIFDEFADHPLVDDLAGEYVRGLELYRNY